MAGVSLSKTALRRATRCVVASSNITFRPPQEVQRSARWCGSPRRSFWGSSKATTSMTFVDGNGNETPVVATEGQTLLEVAHANDIGIEGACGGNRCCSTCHLIFDKAVFDSLPEIAEEEEDVLDLAWGLTDTSRLGCQIKVSKQLEGARIRVPDESNNPLK